MSNSSTTRPTDYPGKTFGIIGFIVSFFLPVVGLIISAVAASQSKKAGFKNGFAKAGIIIGVVSSVLLIIGTIIALANGFVTAGAGV